MKAVLEVGDVMLLLPLDVVDQTSKDATSPHKAGRLSVTPVIVEHLGIQNHCKKEEFPLDLLLRDLETLLVLRFAAWWLDIRFRIPVPWQRLDAVDVVVQGLDQLLFAVGIVDLLDEVPVEGKAQ